MSHKIHKNPAAKQQAYRDRIEKARVAAAKAFRAAGSNIHLPLGQAHLRGEHKQQPDPTCPACLAIQNTVTQNSMHVTVCGRDTRKTHSIMSDSTPKMTDCHRLVADCLVAPEGERPTCERCNGHYGQNTVTGIRIGVTVLERES
jgi:hypothetical protein